MLCSHRRLSPGLRDACNRATLMNSGSVRGRKRKSYRKRGIVIGSFFMPQVKTLTQGGADQPAGSRRALILQFTRGRVELATPRFERYDQSLQYSIRTQKRGELCLIDVDLYIDYQLKPDSVCRSCGAGSAPPLWQPPCTGLATRPEDVMCRRL